jgi:hypothetical protein
VSVEASKIFSDGNLTLQPAADVLFQADAVPSLTDTWDLGSSLKLWRQGYLSQLNAVLFAKETVSLFGGWSMVTPNAGTFAAAVAVGDTTIDFGTAMTPGAFVCVRAADAGGIITAEYLQVGDLVGGTVYGVTRNLAGLGAKSWARGVPFAVFGTAGQGRIELNAYDTPRLSVLSQGATYNAQTEHVRLGYLDGFLAVPNGKIGLGIGDASQYLTYYDGALTVRGSVTVTGGSWSHASDTTRIDGGDIYTGSITADKITVGDLQAFGATIGGWTLDATSIKANAGAVGMSSAQVGAADVRFWAGHATPGSAPFRVTEAGALTATNAAITGSLSAASGAVAINNTGITVLAGTDEERKVKVGAGWLWDNSSYLELWGPAAALCETNDGCATLNSNAWVHTGGDNSSALGSSADPWDDLYIGGPDTLGDFNPLVISSGRVMEKTDGIGTTNCTAGTYMDGIAAESGIITNISCSTPAPAPAPDTVTAARLEALEAQVVRLAGDRVRKPADVTLRQASFIGRQERGGVHCPDGLYLSAIDTEDGRVVNGTCEPLPDSTALADLVDGLAELRAELAKLRDALPSPSPRRQPTITAAR